MASGGVTDRRVHSELVGCEHPASATCMCLPKLTKLLLLRFEVGYFSSKEEEEDGRWIIIHKS